MDVREEDDDVSDAARATAATSDFSVYLSKCGGFVLFASLVRSFVFFGRMFVFFV
jgi:hypothetical protein